MKVGDFVRDKRVRDIGYVSAVGDDGMIEIRFNDGVLWMERTAVELATTAKWGCGGMVDTTDLKSVPFWECWFKSSSGYQRKGLEFIFIIFCLFVVTLA